MNIGKTVKIIISVFLVLFSFTIVFLGIRFYLNQREESFAKVVESYMTTSKNTNNQLMNMADLFDKTTVGLTYSEAEEYLVADINKCKELKEELDLMYAMVKSIKTDNKNIVALKKAAAEDYKQLKLLYSNVLEKTEENFGENYSKTYKAWEEPFAEAHQKLALLLSKY